MFGDHALWITNIKIPGLREGAGGSPPALSSPFYIARNLKPLAHNFLPRLSTPAALFSIVHYKFIAFNCCKVNKIPPFAILIKRIKIASFRVHRQKVLRQEEEMRFQPRENKQEFPPMDHILINVETTE